jgi:hypothetical protein
VRGGHGLLRAEVLLLTLGCCWGGVAETNVFFVGGDCWRRAGVAYLWGAADWR